MVDSRSWTSSTGSVPELAGGWTVRRAERHLPVGALAGTRHECVDGRLVVTPFPPAVESVATATLASAFVPAAEAAGTTRARPGQPDLHRVLLDPAGRHRPAHPAGRRRAGALGAGDPVHDGGGVRPARCPAQPGRPAAPLRGGGGAVVPPGGVGPAAPADDRRPCSAGTTAATRSWVGGPSPATAFPVVVPDRLRPGPPAAPDLTGRLRRTDGPGRHRDPRNPAGSLWPRPSPWARRFRTLPRTRQTRSTTGPAGHVGSQRGTNR